MRDYGTMFLALILGGIAAIVLGLVLVTAHSRAAPLALFQPALEIWSALTADAAGGRDWSLTPAFVPDAGTKPRFVI